MSGHMDAGSNPPAPGMHMQSFRYVKTSHESWICCHLERMSLIMIISPVLTTDLGLHTLQSYCCSLPRKSHDKFYTSGSNTMPSDE